MRVICAPRRRRFVGAFLNVIDLLAVLSFYVFHVARFAKDLLGMNDSAILGKALEFLRVARVLRLMKLARHSPDLQAGKRAST